MPAQIETHSLLIICLYNHVISVYLFFSLVWLRQKSYQKRRFELDYNCEVRLRVREHRKRLPQPQATGHPHSQRERALKGRPTKPNTPKKQKKYISPFPISIITLFLAPSPPLFWTDGVWVYYTVMAQRQVTAFPCPPTTSFISLHVALPLPLVWFLSPSSPPSITSHFAFQPSLITA